jgi:hypothetical protein
VVDISCSKGVLNVPRDLLIDIDETSVVLYSAERRFGHAPRGRRATTLSPSPRGTKFTVILAIARNGIVCWDISTQNTDAQKFRQFVHFCLCPALGKKGTIFKFVSVSFDSLSFFSLIIVSSFDSSNI